MPRRAGPVPIALPAAPLVALAALLCALSMNGAAPAAAAQRAPDRAAAPPPAALQRAVDAVVAAGAPGIVVHSRAGRRSVELAAGLADRGPAVRLRAGDRFRVGSLTKTFVATVVLQLVAENRMTLDDPIERWLPGAVPGGAGITVRQLLAHTSGLFNYTDDPSLFRAGFGKVWRPAELLARAVAEPPRFAPGTSWEYSNTNYIVLGLVVEAVTGRPLADELTTRIARPLRLTRTSLDRRRRIRGRHAHGFIDAGGRRVDVTAASPTVAWAAGGLVSSARDVARFHRALLGGRLLPAPLLDAMKAEDPLSRQGGRGYGFGLMTVRTPCGSALGHDGAFPGYVSNALTSADGRRSIVVLVNTSTISRRLGTAIDALLTAGLCGRR